MKIYAEETPSEPMSTPVDTTPKLTWQTPHLEDLSIQDTAGPNGPYDGDDDVFGEPFATLS